MNTFDAYLDHWLHSIKVMGGYQKLFLTGCPKSGTTWLVRSLNGHPEIVADGEGRFAWRLFWFLQQAFKKFNEDQKQHGGSVHGLIPDVEQALVMRSFAENVFLRYLRASGKDAAAVRVLADKTPQHVLEFSALRTIYPNCRFINMVRDPRDAATSALFGLGANDNRSKEEYVNTFITQTWRLHMEAAVNAEKQIGAESFMNVRYEDLHADDATKLRQCLKHAGVNASDEMVARCVAAGKFEKFSGGRKRGETDQNSFNRSGTVGDWKNHLDPGLARACCQPVEGLMLKFGYLPDSVPVMRTTAGTSAPALETSVAKAQQVAEQAATLKAINP
jgi:hypothetical protein